MDLTSNCFSGYLFNRSASYSMSISKTSLTIAFLLCAFTYASAEAFPRVNIEEKCKGDADAKAFCEGYARAKKNNETVGELLNECNQSKFYCGGYLQALLEPFTFQVCHAYQSLTNEAAVNFFLKWAAAHPEFSKLAASDGIWRAADDDMEMESCMHLGGAGPPPNPQNK